MAPQWTFILKWKLRHRTAELSQRQLGLSSTALWLKPGLVFKSLVRNWMLLMEGAWERSQHPVARCGWRAPLTGSVTFGKGFGRPCRTGGCDCWNMSCIMNVQWLPCGNESLLTSARPVAAAAQRDCATLCHLCSNTHEKMQQQQLSLFLERPWKKGSCAGHDAIIGGEAVWSAAILCWEVIGALRLEAEVPPERPFPLEQSLADLLKVAKGCGYRSHIVDLQGCFSFCFINNEWLFSQSPSLYSVLPLSSRGGKKERGFFFFHTLFSSF